MKRTMMVLMAAALIAGSVPAMAAQPGAATTQEMDEQCRKECDLLVRNCGNEVDSIQQRIQKLKVAVKNNSGAYTRDQLKKLQDKLAEAQKTLNDIESGGR